MAGVCSTPGCPEFSTYRGKCARHARQANRHQHRTVPTKVARTAPERRRRAAAVAKHRSQHGDWCPGYGTRTPHPASDLTADHVTPIAAGGDPSGPLIVRCRSCNSVHGSRTS